MSPLLAWRLPGGVPARGRGGFRDGMGCFEFLGRKRRIREMDSSTRGFTLWELASVVREEVEKVFAEEQVVRDVSDRLLLYMIQAHVKNVRVEEDVSDPVFRGGHGAR
jgi:hypothetical protein